MELPVAEERFTTYDLIDKGDVPGFELNFGDSALTLKKTDSLYYTIEKGLIAEDSSVNEEVFGPMILKNTPVIDMFFSVLVSDELEGAPLLSDFQFNSSSTKSLDGIRSATFDEESVPLEIAVKNTAKSATLNDVTISVFNYNIPLGQVKLSSINAGELKTGMIDVRNKSVRDSIHVSVDAIIPGGAVLNSGDGLRVIFSFDGLSSSDATICDTMIDYTDSFTGCFCLSDLIDLKTIDLDKARLVCAIENPAKIQFEFDGVINNAWDLDFAERNNLHSLTQLSTLQNDSIFFAGNVIHDTLYENPYNINLSSSFSFEIPLNEMRLFPTWNADSMRSVLDYVFTITAVPDKRYVHFNKNDVWRFKLKTKQFPFIQIDGTFIDSIVEPFSSEHETGFDWESGIIDSLRKAFRFDSAKMFLDLTPDLPPQSSIDSLRLDLQLNSDINPNSQVVSNIVLENLIPDTTFYRNIDINPIINDWPNTIGINSRVVLPKNTALKLFNKKNSQGQYSNTLTVGMNIIWKLQIPFAWHVTDTIITELEPSSFTLDSDDMDWINKIENVRAVFNLFAVNKTNVNAILHALGSSEKHSDELMAIPDSVIGRQDIENLIGENIFCIFGSEGLEVKPRGDTCSAIATLDNRGVDALISDEGCAVRWFLVMPFCNSDQFNNSDYLDFRATAIVEGIGRADSLLYWGNK
ncbi:MAG: hypothetical protein Q4F84_00550 [Fibrobacter sp.]|nr:hypothetical protein [Fibrobacter sp.]